MVAFVALPFFLKIILSIESCDCVKILCYFIALFYTCSALYQLPWYMEKYMEIFFFLEQRATTETEIFLQVILACYFLPFCLFLFTFGQKELIQSQIYTMQRYYYKSRLPDWGQLLEELV